MKPTSRGHRLWILYRLSEKDYSDILAHQNGVCAGCSRPGKKIRLSCDHDHLTGLVRGLLCMNCNKALGLVSDRPARLRQLADYLESPPAVEALGREVYGMLGRALVEKKVKKYGPPKS